MIGAQTYPDDPETSETSSVKGVRSVRTEKMAIIPSSAGNLTLPAIEFNWWNTSTQSMETAILPERTLAILPGNAAANTNPAAINDSNSTAATITQSQNPVTANNEATGTNYWRPAFFTAIGLWLLTTLGLLLGRRTPIQSNTNRQTNNETSEQQAWQKLEQVKSNPIALRAAVLGWAKKFWKHHSINSLSDISLASRNDGLKKELMALDASLFQDDKSSFDANKLLQLLEKERTSGDIPENDSGSAIRPLYKSDASY